MKKITDERLILRNLQHIKITYIVQTIGILCILGYELFQGGIEEMRQTPLWIIFILTSVVHAYLSMSVNVENEKRLKSPKRSFTVSLAVLTTIVIAVAYLTSNTTNFGRTDGLIMGTILFVCGFIPLYYVYHLRVKQEKNTKEDD